MTTPSIAGVGSSDASEVAVPTDAVGEVTVRVVETTPGPTPASSPVPSPPAATAAGPSAPSPPRAPAPAPAPTPQPASAQPPPAASPPPPSPSPPSSPSSWPREGSFVEYHMTGEGRDPPGESYETHLDARLRLIYGAGVWSGTCDWSSTTLYFHGAEDGGPSWVNESGEVALSIAPLREATDVDVGDKVVIEDIGERCQTGALHGEIPVVSRTTHGAPRQEDGSESWYAYIEYEWPGDAYAYWDTSTGLVLAWRDQGHYSYHDGWMVDTDAPLS